MIAVIALATGFIVGVIYSRNKADPVHAALFDGKRIVRFVWDSMRYICASFFRKRRDWPEGKA